DLAGGKGADGELSIGDLAHAPGDQLGAAVQRVEALRPARGEAPLDARLRLRDGRRSDCAGGDSGSSFLKKRSALHDFAPQRMRPGIVTANSAARRARRAPSA